MLNFNSLKNLGDYTDTTPKMDIAGYFNGHIKAWGIIQNWRGQVISRFDVNMEGSWKGNQGTLKETFRYYDGSTQNRTWHITRRDDGSYEGRADDIAGAASGAQAGSAARWAYRMDVPVEGKTYRITFDDWMWQLNDGVVVNRSYLKKFGITVAELTLFMQKQ